MKSNEFIKNWKFNFNWQVFSTLTFCSAMAFCFMMMPLKQAYAGGADVVNVEFKKTSNDTYRFEVTVRHDDEGWDHYANQWQVVAPDGTVLATRVLAHPHVNEQPFTRSKSGIKIPHNVKEVTIRAGDSVHGFTGKEMMVPLN